MNESLGTSFTLKTSSITSSYITFNLIPSESWCWGMSIIWHYQYDYAYCLTFSIGLFIHFLIEAYECFAAKHFHFIWPSETDFSLWRPTKLDAIVFHFPESQGVLWCPHLKSGSLVAYHPFCEDLSINHSLDHKLQCKNYVKFKQV